MRRARSTCTGHRNLVLSDAYGRPRTFNCFRTTGRPCSGGCDGRRRRAVQPGARVIASRNLPPTNLVRNLFVKVARTAFPIPIGANSGNMVMQCHTASADKGGPLRRLIPELVFPKKMQRCISGTEGERGVEALARLQRGATEGRLPGRLAGTARPPGQLPHRLEHRRPRRLGWLGGLRGSRWSRSYCPTSGSSSASARRWCAPGSSRRPWRTVDAVELATFDWVDWFNNGRLLAPIGYFPPVECEEQYYRRREAPAMVAGVT